MKGAPRNRPENGLTMEGRPGDSREPTQIPAIPWPKVIEPSTASTRCADALAVAADHRTRTRWAFVQHARVLFLIARPHIGGWSSHHASHACLDWVGDRPARLVAPSLASDVCGPRRHRECAVEPPQDRGRRGGNQNQKARSLEAPKMGGSAVGHVDLQRTPEERRRTSCPRSRGPSSRGVSDHVSDIPAGRRARQREPRIHCGAPRRPLRGDNHTLETQRTSGDVIAQCGRRPKPSLYTVRLRISPDTR